jgi:hypothetical protein
VDEDTAGVVGGGLATGARMRFEAGAAARDVEAAEPTEGAKGLVRSNCASLVAKNCVEQEATFTEQKRKIEGNPLRELFVRAMAACSAAGCLTCWTLTAYREIKE